MGSPTGGLIFLCKLRSGTDWAKARPLLRCRHGPRAPLSGFLSAHWSRPVLLDSDRARGIVPGRSCQGAVLVVGLARRPHSDLEGAAFSRARADTLTCAWLRQLSLSASGSLVRKAFLTLALFSDRVVCPSCACP